MKRLIISPLVLALVLVSPLSAPVGQRRARWIQAPESI